MRRNPDAKGTAVELLNVPMYGQGEFDGLCAYYTGAMMLATLFPDYYVEFGRATSRAVKSMSRDPLMRHYGAEDDRITLARWFHHGETIEKVVQLLNRNMKWEEVSTRFKCDYMDRGDRTFDRIARSVDEGLPVMLGWDTEDYGCHAVLATGYWIGQEKWLNVNDPGGVSKAVSWNSLKAQQKGRGKFGVGSVADHKGPRPMKSVTEEQVPVVYQWTPKQKYERVVDLFADAGWTGLQRLRPAI